MATAKARQTFAILLELSTEEAETLYFVCQRIGGDPDKTARGLMDSIRKALDKVEIDKELDFNLEQGRSAIHFTA